MSPNVPSSLGLSPSGPVEAYVRACLDGCAAGVAAILGHAVTATPDPGAAADAIVAFLPAWAIGADVRLAAGRVARQDLLLSDEDARTLAGAAAGATEPEAEADAAAMGARLADVGRSLLASVALSLARLPGPAPTLSLTEVRRVESVDEASPAGATVGTATLDGAAGPAARVAVVVPAALAAEILGGREAGASAGNGGLAGLDMILDISMPITVELGRTRMLIRDILALGPGSVVELERLAGEPVDLLVNDRPIAKGEVVVIDDNFGIRLTQISHAAERIRSLA
jgi:flagellar motor switch protein FliN/FliY